MNPSSQSLAPFTRLLWKEYRVQRSLWLALLVLGVVPQFLVRIAATDQITRVEVVWAMVIVFPFLFVIGSAAILFAGEREERTADWLHNLAVPPLWTLLTKLSFLLVATVALAATLSIVAVLLVWTVPVTDEPYESADFAMRSLWTFVGVFIWSVFGSLLSRRVITSVPAMGFWWLMTLLVPVIGLPALLGILPGHPQYRHVSDFLLVAAFIAVALADLVLGWRWCQGKYIDSTVLDGANAVFIAWQNELRWQRVPVARMPSKPEADSQWRREWQRLIWQERHRDRYHRTLLYLGWSVSLMLAFLGTPYGVSLMPGIIVLIVTLPLAMGVLGFRYDGEGQPLRFLGNRGIEARLLWTAKHAVWLPRAFWIPLAVWLVAGIAEKLTGRNYTGPPSRELLNAVRIFQTYPGAVLGFIFLTYGCGHLAAMLLRRVVLAAVIGVAASFVATLWLGLAIAMIDPLWWSAAGLLFVGGPLLWIFALSYWIAPIWLMERPLFSRATQLTAFVIPPLVLIGAWATWRASEIPGLKPNWISGGLSPELEVAATSFRHELGNYSNSLATADQKHLERLAATLGGFFTQRDFERQIPPPADAVKAFWETNEPRLNELIEITRSRRGPSLTRYISLTKVDPLQIGGLEAGRVGGLLPQQQLLLEAGRLRTQEGRLDDALAYFCASMRLASYWATDQGLSARHEGHRQQLHTLQSILEWANHPEQTGETLRSARQRIQIEFDLFPSMHQSLIAEHLRELAGLEESIRHGTRYVDPPDSVGRILLFDCFRLLPWEQVRARRYLEQQHLERDELAKQLSEELRVPGLDANRFFEQRRQNTRILQLVGQSRELQWRLTTPLAPGRDADFEIPLVIEREVVIRESMLALSLLAWRKEHQQWPESLGDLLAKEEDGRAMSAITLIDPWSGELFEYKGTLLNQWADKNWPAVLLSTAGPSGLREIFVNDPQDGYATTSQGVGIAMATWRGTRAYDDDRLLLKVTDGKLAFQLMNSQRFLRKKADSPRGAAQ